MKTQNYMTVRVDSENNAETWWDALRERYPRFAQSLQQNDQVTIATDLFAQLEALPGWQDGPAYAPTALMAEYGGPVGSTAGRTEVFDELS